LAYVYKRSKFTGSHYISNAFEVVTSVLISIVFIVVKKKERISWTLFILSVVYSWVKNGIAVGIQLEYRDGIIGMISGIGIGIIGMSLIFGYILFKIIKEKESYLG
jgi:hypothetical protein